LKKNIIIFGCGNSGQDTYNYIKDNFNIVAFIDNNKELHNTYMLNIKILNPSEINLITFDFIVIASMYKYEIKEQLIVQYKIPIEQIISLDDILAIQNMTTEIMDITKNNLENDSKNILQALFFKKLFNDKSEQNNLMKKVSYLMKQSLGDKKLIIDMLQSSFIGGQAYESFIRVPISKKGYMNDRDAEIIVNFSSKSANKTLTNLIAREIPLLQDESFPAIGKYSRYDWDSSKFHISNNIYDDFFTNNGYLFQEFVEFKDSCYAQDYMDGEDHVVISEEGKILKFNQQELQKGYKFLQDVVGFGDNDWFVCIYARDGGYYNETKDSPNWFRNSDINDYKLAIEEIILRGGYVIRVGSDVVNPLDYNHPKVFDYSMSRYQNDFLDIFLLSECKFFLGTHSGLSHVNTIFKTPQLLVNVVNCNGGYHSKLLWIPKKIVDIKTEKILSYVDFLDRYYGYGDRSILAENGIKQVELLGVRYINNTSEEILEATIDMLNELKGLTKMNNIITSMQNDFLQVLEKWNIGYTNLPISTSFLRSNKNLFKKDSI